MSFAKPAPPGHPLEREANESPVETATKGVPKQDAPRPPVGISCPWCKSSDTGVRQTWDLKGHGIRKRRRYCRSCGRTYLTDETYS